MRNMRIYDDPVPPSEVFGWVFVNVGKMHHFAIKNICAYVGPSMIYDEALNSNYYAIRVEDPDRIEEVRKNFESIIFTEDDIAGTRLSYYPQATLIKKYMETVDE